MNANQRTNIPGFFFRKTAPISKLSAPLLPQKFYSLVGTPSKEQRSQENRNVNLLASSSSIPKRWYSSSKDSKDANPSKAKAGSVEMTPSEFNKEELKFEKAKAEQLDLLKSWLQKPHITKYWGDGGLTIPDYIRFTSDQPSIFNHYFGFYSFTPIVFLMTSVAEEGGNLDQWREKGGKNLTLDIMIGDENFVGKGFAPLILEEFFEQKCQDATAILIDPELTHKKAIRVYEKVGFVPQGIHVPKEGGWSGIEHLILKKVLKKP